MTLSDKSMWQKTRNAPTGNQNQPGGEVVQNAIKKLSREKCLKTN